MELSEQKRAGGPVSGDGEAIGQRNTVDWALGPGSVTWTVFKDPATFFIGMLRTSLVIPLHPPFAASSQLDTSYLDDPLGRFKRIAVFMYTAVYGSCEEAQRVAQYVIRSHDRIKGTEPLTQLPFSAQSEYELALTSAVQTLGFLAAHEELHGELSTAKRDQLVQEQKVLGAILGVNPDHLPSTYVELVGYLNDARQHWAAGLTSRELCAPFNNIDYPKGTLIGNLPWLKRKIVMWLLRALTDMAIFIMVPEERALLAIGRRPKLYFKFGVKRSFHMLSWFMRSRKGFEAFNTFIGSKVSAIYKRALEIEESPGSAARAATFKVPTPETYMYVHPELVRNWPGSPAAYRLGGANGEVTGSVAPIPNR